MRRMHGGVPAWRHRDGRGLAPVLERVLHEIVVHLEPAADARVDVGDSLESHVIVSGEARLVVARARQPDAVEAELLRALLHELELGAPQALAACSLGQVQLAQKQEVVVGPDAHEPDVLAGLSLVHEVVLVALVRDGGRERFE